VIREVKEESGLLIKNPILKGILNFPDFDGENDWIVFVYLAKDFDGDLIDSREGVLEWIDIKDVLKIPLWEGDKVFLKYIFKDNGFFYGTFYYKNKKLIDFKFQII